MILTNEKIAVTEFMMAENNMTRFGQYGIPVDPNDPSKGLAWKSYLELTDDDFDALEAYFINKERENNPSPTAENP